LIDVTHASRAAASGSGGAVSIAASCGAASVAASLPASVPPLDDDPPPLDEELDDELPPLVLEELLASPSSPELLDVEVFPVPEVGDAVRVCVASVDDAEHAANAPPSRRAHTTLARDHSPMWRIRAT
jgi:hypothetical protein